MFPFTPAKPVSSADKKKIEEAIRQSEVNTSGEIKVIIEKKLPHVAIETRTMQLFEQYQLFNTAQRNAVLIYIAIDNRQFYILADEGIYQKLGQSYWQSIVDKSMLTIKTHSSWCEGICEIIGFIGMSLKEHYPKKQDDVDEISNQLEVLS